MIVPRRYVETWLHVIEVIESIYSSLPKGDKEYAHILVPWMEENRFKNTGLPQSDINNIILWFENNVPLYVTGEALIDAALCVSFLNHINVGRPAEHCGTVAGCNFWGYEWRGGVCYEDEEDAPPTPDDEKLCEDWKTMSRCLKAGCYWTGRECVNTIPDILEEDDAWYTSVILEHGDYRVLRIIEEADKRYDWWTTKLVDYTMYADVAAVLEEYMDVFFDWGWKNINAFLTRVREIVGDITKIEGTTIIDELEKKGEGGDAQVKNVTTAILEDLEYSYSYPAGTVTRHTDGIIAKAQLVVNALVKDGNVVTIPTIENVVSRLNAAYSDTEDTSMTFLRDLDYVERQVRGVEKDHEMTLREIINKVTEFVGVIVGDIEFDLNFDLLIPTGHVLDFLPATYGWVKEYVEKAAIVIFTEVLNEMKPIVDRLNMVSDIVMEFPDWWIANLKERLGI